MNAAERAQAVQSALAKYRGTAFEWGKTDCLHLARSVLVKIGAKGLPKPPNYSTELQAIRRLKKQGHDSLESLLLAYCIEIPPAWAVVGDIGTVAGDGRISAAVVCAGGSWLGWPADHPEFAVVKLTPERAYRYV